MRKNLITVVFIVLALALGSMTAFGDLADDYKVIKKAAKNNKGGAEIAWFRLEVTDKTEKKTKVKIKLPVSLVDMVADSFDDDMDLVNKKGHKIDLKKILKDLKKHGPMTIIEVDDDDAYVRIWFE